MTRKKLRLDELEVDSFATDAKEVPAGRQEREGGVRAHGSHETHTHNPDFTCDFSCLYGGTAVCDTDQECSGVCLMLTNICGPCE